ncbi:MAG: citrulline utilization hydrolase CtlX [Dermatophilaceae bacterium]
MQAPRAVVMVRPHQFRPNPDTAADNAFQRPPEGRTASELAQAAYDEVTGVAETLATEGVTVHLFEDEGQHAPDSVFPNNWFSTHPGGHVAVFPMYAPNRRAERRGDVVEFLKRAYRVQDVIDYSGLEHDGIYLEGTGAMVLDHVGRIAYAARSNRSNEVALERFCTHFRFEPMVFDAEGPGHAPIYHTNVLMCIATEFALVGLSAIRDPGRRDEVEDSLVQTGREVIALTHEQIASFAGNAIELTSSTGRVLAMSRRALASLTDEQREKVTMTARILAFDIPTIELAGGSVRCMLAGLHLAPRSAARGEPASAVSPAPVRADT